MGRNVSIYLIYVLILVYYRTIKSCTKYAKKFLNLQTSPNWPKQAKPLHYLISMLKSTLACKKYTTAGYDGYG